MQSKWWQPENRALIREYFRLFRPYRKRNRRLVFWAAVGLAVTTGVSLLLPWVTMRAVDSIIRTKQIQELVSLLIFWIVAILARSLGSFLSFYYLMIFRQRMAITGQITLLKHILRLPISYFSSRDIGYVVCRVRDDVGALQPFWAGTHLTVVQSVLFVIASLILLFTISVKLTLVILVLSPIYLLHSFLFLKRIRDLGYEFRESAGLAEGKLHEAISGAPTLKTLTMERYAVRNYFHRIKKAIRTQVRWELLGNVKANLSGFLTSLVPVLVSCYAGYLIYKGSLSVGEFIGFSVYVSFLLNPLASLFDINTQMQQALAPLQRVFEVMHAKQETDTAAVTAKPSPPPLMGDVDFKNVSFSYDNAKMALSDVTVHFDRGSKVGIAGISGAGKSTFVHLLVRLYEPLTGTILFDGVDARTIPTSHIRRHIGIVSQDIFLFNDTVYENLACGNRLLGRTEVEAAARTAGAHDFILAMKDGYQTVVGVRGMKLSGGERARLSIARAILRNPSILIFDEATAFIDSVTERIFRDASETLFRDKTLIFIAHRLASICDTDNIMVFESGRVVQQGTHEELINLTGLYQRLYLEQAKPSQMGETMKASLSDATLRVED